MSDIPEDAIFRTNLTDSPSGKNFAGTGKITVIFLSDFNSLY